MKYIILSLIVMLSTTACSTSTKQVKEYKVIDISEKTKKKFVLTKEKRKELLKQAVKQYKKTFGENPPD